MFKKVLIASAMLVSVVSANAIGFGVAGVITPAPCTITLSGSGNADYGTVTAITVKSYSTPFPSLYDMAGTHQLTYNVSCNAPTKVAMSFVDSHAGKIITADGNDPIRFGLVDGPSGTAAIGHYEISVGTILMDGVAAAGTLMTANGGTAWSTSGPSGIPSYYMAPGYTVGYTKTGAATTPDAMTTMSGVLNFVTRVSKPYVDAATAPVTLNGAGTLALVYI